MPLKKNPSPTAVHPKRILVRAPNWIGDQILAFPFFYYLRQAYPKAHIASVCVPWVQSLQFRNLVDEVITLPYLKGGNVWQKVRVLRESGRELRGGKSERKLPWDLAISLPNSFSAAWHLYQTGARVRRGYADEGRSFLLTEALPWDPTPHRHRSQAYVDLLPNAARPRRRATEFWGVPPENDLDSSLPGEVSGFDPIRSWPLEKADLAEPPSEPYWVVAPGATAESRRWPPEYFLQLIEQVTRETGWRCLIVGGPAEAPLAAEWIKRSDLPLVDATALGPVAGLWPVFRGARFTLCNESGLAHLAALCGSPVHIVCGAADPRRTRPLGPAPVLVAMNSVECWPCEKNTCAQPAGGKLQCLLGIRYSTVWAETKGLIGLDPPKPHAEDLRS